MAKYDNRDSVGVRMPTKGPEYRRGSVLGGAVRRGSKTFRASPVVGMRDS